MIYENIVALDYAKSNMAVASLKKGAKEIKVFEMVTDMNYLKKYLEEINGTVQLVFEVSASARKLFFELRSCVDDVIVCDPVVNKPIQKGPKNDKIDAVKLVKLAKSGELKNVFLDVSDNFKLRKLVSGYIDVVKALVRAKNQRADLKNNAIDSKQDEFVLELKIKEVKEVQEIKDMYEKQIDSLVKENPDIKRLSGVPGIGAISALKIVSTVVSAERFKRTKDFWGYCGLARYKIESGGRFYGTRQARYNSMLKAVFKMAALVSIKTSDEFRMYYDYLTRIKLVPDYDARNTIARHIAKTCLMMLKHKTKYIASLLKKKAEALAS